MVNEAERESFFKICGQGNAGGVKTGRREPPLGA
jgi:hypothetical protein